MRAIRFVVAIVAWVGLLVVSGAAPARAADSFNAAERGHTIRAGAVTLYVEERGGGAGTPLLMVNGGPGFDHIYVHCSGAWDELAKKRRVVFYDQRGNGRSGKLKSGVSCTLGDQIADLDAVRASLGAGRVDLLGHSWGGYLVMAYAARHPEHIAHLMIVDSAAPKWSETEFLFKNVFPEGMERQQAVQFAEALGDSMALHQDLHEYLQMLFYDPDHRDAFMAHADQYHYAPEINRTLNADLEKYDLGPELAKFKIPTMVITGRYDMNVAPSTAWKIHQRIAGSRFVVFERSGHLPYFEEPAAFVRTIEEFLGH